MDRKVTASGGEEKKEERSSEEMDIFCGYDRRHMYIGGSVLLHKLYTKKSDGSDHFQCTDCDRAATAGV